MSFKLANVDGKSVLVSGDHYYDLATISDSNVSSDPSAVIYSLDAIAKLYAQLDQFEPTGSLENTKMGAPITGSRNCFAVGLNYNSFKYKMTTVISMYTLLNNQDFYYPLPGKLY